MKQNDDNLQHILEKLRKLMDLKNSATECGNLGEANAAAAGITRLLKLYDLTLQDIPDGQKALDPVDIEDVPFRFTYRQFRWYWALLDTLAAHNGCEIIRERTFRGRSVVATDFRIIGRRRNREVTLYLISFCAHRFIAAGRNAYSRWRLDYMRSTGLTPMPLASYMKSFLVGCVDGLAERLRSELADIPSERLGALVRADKAALADFMATMTVSNARHRPIRVNGQVLQAGREVGLTTELQRGLGADGLPLKRLA